MNNQDQNRNSIQKISLKDKIFEVEINRIPIYWNLDKGILSFYGIESTLFWNDPSLIYMLAPLAEEIGNDLFRMLIANSSSMGTKKDYYNMVLKLGSNFKDGFLAWGRAVSSAGWGTFEMPEYKPDQKKATILIHNAWEIRTQRNLPAGKRWGAPFIQGKIIGIFNHAFGNRCWADDVCHYDLAEPFIELKVFPSSKTILEEIKKLRYQHMIASEQELSDKVEIRTAELRKAEQKIKQYSKTLEHKVAARTADLAKMNAVLKKEIEIRKEAELKKELLISDLQKTLNEVKVLRGLLPICSSCKKIRDDQGYWAQIETYISNHSEAQFSHGICPECLKKLYPDLDV